MKQNERLKQQRLARKANGNIHTKRYEKTKPGFLMRCYRNMKSRITGIQHKKAHLYVGKSILSKEEFYQWAMDCETFHKLFKTWIESKYERRLTPSVDRIDSRCGYELKNMEWVPFHVNCSRGAKLKNFDCDRKVLE